MLLQVDGITKSYGSGTTGNFRTVLGGIDLQVNEGESIAILGPSGSGKTTLLNIIGSLDYPDSGSVRFRDKDISTMSEKEIDTFRNRQIGFIFQFHHLLPQCTLLENVLLPVIGMAGRSEKSQKLSRAEELMKRIGLWELRNQKPGRTSGGECQRTAVIRAMINSPSLLLADEPTGALDTGNAENLADLLVEIHQTYKVSLVVVSHSRSLADRMNTRYELKNGILVKL
jgi:ABC-type lipoprotein export system ATPase subunit